MSPINVPFQSLLDELSEIVLKDLQDSLGIYQGLITECLSPVLRASARSFARTMAIFNARAAATTSAAAAQWLLGRLGQHWELTGQQHIPAEGPLLILSNHPGMTDTLGLMAYCRRPDVKILALDRPFLRSLHSLQPQLILVPQTGGLRALRPALAHLERGGALLNFAAGKIESDPAIHKTKAAISRRQWSPSTHLFLRRIKRCAIVEAQCSGVIDPLIRRLTLLHVRRDPANSERIAAALQLLAAVFLPKLFRRTPALSFRPVGS